MNVLIPGVSRGFFFVVQVFVQAIKKNPAQAGDYFRLFCDTSVSFGAEQGNHRIKQVN